MREMANLASITNVGHLVLKCVGIVWKQSTSPARSDFHITVWKAFYWVKRTKLKPQPAKCISSIEWWEFNGIISIRKQWSEFHSLLLLLLLLLLQEMTPPSCSGKTLNNGRKMKGRVYKKRKKEKSGKLLRFFVR